MRGFSMRSRMVRAASCAENRDLYFDTHQRRIIVACIVATWTRSLSLDDASGNAQRSPWVTIKVRPGLMTRPLAMKRAPAAGRSRLTLNSTLSTSAPAGISVVAARPQARDQRRGRARMQEAVLLGEVGVEVEADLQFARRHPQQGRTERAHQRLCFEDGADARVERGVGYIESAAVECSAVECGVGVHSLVKSRENCISEVAPPSRTIFRSKLSVSGGAMSTVPT